MCKSADVCTVHRVSQRPARGADVRKTSLSQPTRLSGAAAAAAAGAGAVVDGVKVVVLSEYKDSALIVSH